MQLISSQVEDATQGRDCLCSVPSASNGILTVFPSEIMSHGHTDHGVLTNNLANYFSEIS